MDANSVSIRIHGKRQPRCKKLRAEAIAGILRQIKETAVGKHPNEKSTINQQATPPRIFCPCAPQKRARTSVLVQKSQVCQAGSVSKIDVPARGQQMSTSRKARKKPFSSQGLIHYEDMP